jgi:hypothetical protein
MANSFMSGSAGFAATIAHAMPNILEMSQYFAGKPVTSFCSAGTFFSARDLGCLPQS